MREEPNGDTYYGYGWVVREVDGRTVLWHNGANQWSYGEIGRVQDDGAMVFWVANQARSDTSDWDFEELGAEITDGVIERLLQGG